MSDFKLLISTHHIAFLRPAGGEEELRIFARSLKEFGVTVDVYGVNSKPLNNYDAVLHFSTHADGLTFIHEVKKTNIKLFLWPNLWWTGKQSVDDVKNSKIFFDLADKIFFKSNAELANNSLYFPISPEKSYLLPAPVEKYFYQINKELGEQFKRLYRLKNYILWIGVIQESKNQLQLIKALKNFYMPIVFIGDTVDIDYFKECERISEDKNIFIPNIPHNSDLLLGAISGCSIYIELSDEPAGLSALEVGVAAKNLLLCDSEWTHEHFHGLAHTIADPFNCNEIYNLVEKITSKPAYSDNLSKMLFKKHGYDAVINRFIEILRL